MLAFTDREINSVQYLVGAKGLSDAMQLHHGVSCHGVCILSRVHFHSMFGLGRRRSLPYIPCDMRTSFAYSEHFARRGPTMSSALAQTYQIVMYFILDEI